MPTGFRVFAVATAVGAGLAVLTGARAAERTLVEWTFDRPGDLAGWQPNNHLQDVAVTNGVLRGRAEGADPILELRPLLDLPARPWQVLEVRLRADRSGTAEFFWSGTTQGPYGGFSQEKSTRFNVLGDSAWHTYRLLPGWHTEGKLVRLRFDVFDGARFEVDAIRVAEPVMPPPAARADFDFTRAEHGWQRFDERLWFSPPLDLDAASNTFVALGLAAGPGRRGTLLFATDRAPGLHRFAFHLEPDAGEPVCNLDLLAASAWRGRILLLGLQLDDAAPVPGALRWLKVSDTPQGPAQLAVHAFALEDALPRAGRAATFRALLANLGGQTATNLRAALTLPAGVAVLESAPPEGRVAALGFDEEAEFTWQVRAERPLEGEARLEVSAANAPRPARAAAPLRFTPPLPVAAGGYVPEPQPVRGPFEVGVYYFPGWKTASPWEPIRRFPERKPILGWYREGDPEVADWHIKWAVEHGITFFAYDWYWDRGQRQLEHALHEGYFQARYRRLLKFCLLWANHNPPGSASLDDCRAVTRHWIEHYFRRPEHLTLEGKPVVIIFSPHRLTEDLGSAGAKQALEAMRAECRQAGLPGLYLIACVGDSGGARQAASEGYDAVTAYNWPGLGMTGEGNRAPFETLLEGYRRQWEHLLEQSPLPLRPLPVCGGWDSRPWHGENNLVRFGRTPALFRQHLQDARALLESRHPKLGSPGLILIEAWNEWGEGSYIEPHAEFGFGYLDALREVFTPAPPNHDDVTPADAGRGPYDVPPEPVRTAWEFARDAEGWTHTMDLAEVRAADGALHARTTGRDPAFFGPPTQVRAAAFGAVLVRMKLAPADGQPFTDTAQLFWRTRRWPESEASSARFPVSGDGQWHEYRVPVASHPRWRGVITRLRLDPGTRPEVRVSVDYLRLAP